MSATNASLTRQAGQQLQRVVHLLRRSFKKPTAASGKKRVAAKQQGCVARRTRVMEVRDVSARVTRNVDHFKAQADRDHDVAAFQRDAVNRHGFERGRVDRHIEPLAQTDQSAHMVLMVMRHQDRPQLQPETIERIKYRSTITRIDHGGFDPIVKNPDVVVSKRGQCEQFHG